MENNDLLVLAKKGNKNAIETLFNSHKDKAFNISYRIIQRADIAEDVVIDCYLNIIEKKFNIKDNFASYFYRSVINASINSLKKEKKESITSDEFIYDIISEESPDKITEKKMLLNKIKKAINVLPENQKIAFILIKYEGLSYKETSDIMKKPIKSIESLINRAKITLQKKITEE